MGKKVILYILSFILSLGIFAMLTLFIFSNTLLNKQYVLGILEKNNYYEKTYANIQEGINNYAMQSGLEQEVFRGLYTKEKVIKDINQVVDFIYDNKEAKISVEEIKGELDNRIYNVLEEHQKVPKQKEKESIQKLEDVISETYVNGIVYSSEIVEKINEPLQKIMQSMPKVFMASIVFVCILLLVMGIVSKKAIFSYLGISFITSGVLSVLLQLLVGDRVHYILILNTAFSECVRYMISSILHMFSIVGGTFIIIGIISCIFSTFIEVKKYKVFH